MLDTLKEIASYTAAGFLIILGGYAAFVQARSWLRKDKREAQSGKYQEFNETIQLLQTKVNTQETAIQDLTVKLEKLEAKNQKLLEELDTYNERANHYLALFATRCPYEDLRQGKGICELYHPIDKERIRQKILAQISEEEIDQEIHTLPEEFKQC
jgi:chromosome segregation ATPase